MQVWSKMDFGTGEIIFLDITQKEDMLQVEYPNCFLLDMGWYQDRYIISIIQNFDWTHPVQQYSGLDTGTAPLENSLDRWGLMYEKQQISLEKFLEDQAYIRNL